jgi:hypothetical protein
MRIIILLFYIIKISSFFDSIKNIITHKKSIYKQFILLKKQYNHFLFFIHEFHHIIGSQILFKEYKNLNNSYILVPDTIYPKVFSLFPETCNISFHKNNYTEKEYQEYINSNYLYIVKIKTSLSGYAAEEAFKSKSFLLNYFAIKNHQFKTESFFTLMLDNYIHNKSISDLEVAISYQNQLNYEDILIKNYLKKYTKKIKKNNYIKKEEKKINTIYPYIKENFLQLLYSIYDELILIYKNKDHQSKFYNFLEKSPDLLANEIFFFKDLKSLWQFEELKRDISSINKFNDEEKKIIYQLINKKIYPLQKIKELKNGYKETFALNTLIKKIIIIPELIIKEKNKLCSYFKLYINSK